jgi:ABC-type transport system involved in multi-copper enzyme maturation permease subunit
MNKGVLYYTFLNRIKDRPFLLFYIVGVVLYFIFLYFSVPFNKNSIDFFVKGPITLFLIYFSLVSGLNGLGKDKDRGYLEILLTKSVKIEELLLSYYITYLFFSIFFLAVIYCPTMMFFGSGFNLTFNILIISPILYILLYVSYTIFFSVITKENMYIVAIIILNIFCALLPQINIKFKIISENLFPDGNLKKLIVVLVLLVLSLIFIRRQKKV